MFHQIQEDQIIEIEPSRPTEWLDEFWDRHFEMTGQTREEAWEMLNTLPGRRLEGNPVNLSSPHSL